MEILDFVLSNFIVLTCSMMMAVLFIHAIMSWFFPDAEGLFFNFIRNFIDFLTAPARAILDRTGWFSGLPIDMSHMLTMITLWLITLIFTIF